MPKILCCAALTEPGCRAHSSGCDCARRVTFPPQNVALRGAPPRIAHSAGWRPQQHVDWWPPRQTVPLHDHIAAARPRMRGRLWAPAPPQITPFNRGGTDPESCMAADTRSQQPYSSVVSRGAPPQRTPQ